MNGRAVVGAKAPGGKAVIGLEVAGDGADPEAAMKALEKETGLELAASAERRKVNGLPAVHTTARARTSDGPIALDLTWIAHGGRVYRLTGVTPPGSADAMRPAFRATADSFRPLTSAERASIRETQLRVVTAGAGDTIAKIVGRSDTAWNATSAAVANGVEPADPLPPQTPVKLAVVVPYAPRRSR